MTSKETAHNENGASFYRTWGPLVLFVVAFIIAAFYLFESLAVREKYSYFIVLVSVSATAGYSFLFLVAPEFDSTRGLTGAGTALLAGALLVAFVVSGALLSIYVDLTFLNKSQQDLYVTSAFTGILRPLLPESPFVPDLVNIFVKHHFAIFVLVFSAIDLIFVKWSPRPHEKERFHRVFVVIDVPILIGVFATSVVKSLISENGELFEAGAISFQLIVGSFAAYLLDYYEVLTFKNIFGARIASVGRALCRIKSVVSICGTKSVEKRFPKRAR